MGWSSVATLALLRYLDNVPKVGKTKKGSYFILIFMIAELFVFLVLFKFQAKLLEFKGPAWDK